MALRWTQPLNINEYQESSWGLKGGRRIGLTTVPPSVSLLSRKFGSLDVSQPYGPSRFVTGIAYLYLTTKLSSHYSWPKSWVSNPEPSGYVWGSANRYARSSTFGVATLKIILTCQSTVVTVCTICDSIKEHFIRVHILSPVWVCAWLTRRVLDCMIGFIDRIHTARGYRQYSAIADLHTLQFTFTHALGFSVFTSRILATDLSHSRCNFKSHMKSSFNSLIPFSPFLLKSPWTAISRNRLFYWFVA
jgi:hypothetical protein